MQAYVFNLGLCENILKNMNLSWFRHESHVMFDSACDDKLLSHEKVFMWQKSYLSIEKPDVKK